MVEMIGRVGAQQESLRGPGAAGAGALRAQPEPPLDDKERSRRADRGKRVTWEGAQFHAFRVLRSAAWVYIEHETRGAAELYNLRADPYQLENRIARIDPETRQRLADRLRELRECAADSCRTAEDAPLAISFVDAPAPSSDRDGPRQ
jgi:hypothetical protein